MAIAVSERAWPRTPPYTNDVPVRIPLASGSDLDEAHVAAAARPGWYAFSSRAAGSIVRTNICGKESRVDRRPVGVFDRSEP